MIYKFENVDTFIQYLNGKKIYLMCAGNYGKLVGAYLDKKGIKWLGYLDNNVEKDGAIINGKKVYVPQPKIVSKDYFIIICTVMWKEEIENQLIQMGIPTENICQFEDRNIFMAIGADGADIENQVVRWQKLKLEAQKYSRCFIIGNGPSLRISDLELLKNDFSMGTNAIMQCFDKTIWRPNCYLVGDLSATKDCVELYGLDNFTEECNYLVCNYTSGLGEKCEQYDNIVCYSLREKKNGNLPAFSDNPAEVLFGSSTSIYPMLQVSAFLGFKQIYLLGTDLGFSKVKKTDGTIETRNEKNAYAEFIQSDENSSPVYEEDKIMNGYLAAKKYFDENGITIMNATRGGSLEVFERVMFDDLFN